MCPDHARPLAGSTEAAMRLARFRRRHPGVVIGREFGEWSATVDLPGDDGIGCLHDPDLGHLLDELEGILPGPSG